MNFTRLTLSDIEKVRPLLTKATNRLCDNTVGGLFMWRDFFDSHYFIDENQTLFIRHKVDGEYMFSIPLGKDIKKNILKVDSMCKEKGVPLVFCIVSSDELKILQEMYGRLEINPERDWFDYLYEARNIVSLSGRKYAGQRNHINRFKRFYPGYSFNLIDGSNIKKIRDFLEEYYSKNIMEDAIGIEEKAKVFEVIDNYERYGMVGGFISVDDKVVSISVGEIVYDTLFIHIEKADTDYHGAYQMIVNEYAKNISTPETKYINREEDVGREGLRISKMSYHPLRLLEKYTVKVLPT
ncbi:MAG: DUF2156 domain-containing protein [Clostridiales bacterium]|nr:DUF2156 domain-containing protein [Clostridiales bacterium]